jgi:hypothetical protein
MSEVWHCPLQHVSMLAIVFPIKDDVDDIVFAFSETLRPRAGDVGLGYVHG